MRNTFTQILAISAIIVLSLPASASDRGYRQQQASHGSHNSVSRSVGYPRFGHRISRLPSGHRNVSVGQQRYQYHRGSFYRPHGSGVHIVVSAPIGARIKHLPRGYIRFNHGLHNYFYLNYTYYLWDRSAREYVVVEEPAGAESSVVLASTSSSGEIFVYPNRGQTDEQRDRDRYECYLWAADQTGYDPGAEYPDNSEAGNYRRALSACLEGRGYTVK